MNVFKLIEDNGLQLHGDIEYFAHLVAEAEREKVARWMMKQGYATGHGDTLEDLLKEIKWQVEEREPVDYLTEVVAIHKDGTYTTKQVPILKREWVGLTDNEAQKFYEKYTNREELIYAIDKFLEEKNA